MKLATILKNIILTVGMYSVSIDVDLILARLHRTLVRLTERAGALASVLWSRRLYHTFA